ncbi:MAG: hypothetical protein LBV74_02515 [Tannerella sp.]|jgi:hypothetical protein|nr:hypothetical protein [Tannerella sp.]
MLKMEIGFTKVVTIAICLAGSTTIFAQDIIFRNNGAEIQAIVREVGVDEVKYKKFNNQNGPIYRLRKSEISMIEYEDGSRDVFNDVSASIEDRVQTSVNQKNNYRSNNIYSDYQLPASRHVLSEQDEEQYSKKIYLGVGYGFDYGGLFGGKIELLPIKHLGLFAGAGYNLLSLGWNIGGTLKIFPDRKVSPNLMLMYGYNAVIVGTDSYSEQYEKTSYGVTIGGNVDIKIGRNNKISAGLFVPFRSNEFKEIHDDAKNDPNMSLSPLFPVTFSFGFNFGF